jgi:thiamine biosynthesis lipoprotein
MRWVKQLMGMPITIDIYNCDDMLVFEAAFERLKQIDQKFSTYKSDSEVSRFRRNEISETDLSQELKNIIEQCRLAQIKTNGLFSAWAAGAFDPSGYVKGWAISEAGKVIEARGYQTYCVGAGGDILAQSNSQKVWNVGVQDPTDNNKILNKLSISNGAVATSGNYERGVHIINPKTSLPADELLSVTITGPDIILADVLATTVFVMGESGLKFIESQPGYEALIVNKNKKVYSTKNF